MKKRNFIWMAGIATVSLCLMLTGCGTTSADQNKNQQSEKPAENPKLEINEVTVAVPKAPPALPVLYMIENRTMGEDVNIHLETWDEPETLLAMVQDEEHDIFAFPLTVASKLYNKGLPVRLMNVNTWGVTYFMTTDPDCTSWKDLENKTVYVPLQSSPPDALTQYFLSTAGLKVGENVDFVYASTAEVASMMISGEAQYATLIEPQVTRVLMQNKDARVAMSFEEEWQKVTETETKIPNAGLGTKQPFIDSNPNFTAAFQQAYAEGCTWVNEHPAEAGALAEKYLGLKAALVEKAIPNMGLDFVNASDADTELTMFYQLLYDFDPTMIGGKLPDQGLYYASK